jgi:hypothetical protein
MSHKKTRAHYPGENKMRKTILTVLASAAIAATASQAASATEQHRAHRAPVQATQPVRNAIAYEPLAPAASSYDSRPGYYNGAYSAPAGR